MTAPSREDKTAGADRPRRSWPAAPAWLWPAVKLVVGVAVVAAVGWQFAAILAKPDLWTQPFAPHPGWLAFSAVLYLVGLGFSAFFWYHLLRVLGQRPRGLAAVRAYYVGQLGRYIPGKLVAVGMRARMLTGPGVRFGVAVMTILYEALTTLASGVLVGLLWFAFRAPGQTELLWRAAALLVVVVGLLLPGVFNRLVKWVARPFRAADAPALPRVRATTLGFGLAITGCGWIVQGGTLWAVVTALAPDAWAGTADAWGRCAAYVGLAYAAGFLMFAAPGGLGVRDYLIQHFLAADLSRTLGPDRAAVVAVVAALTIRLLWTTADAASAAAFYWLPVGRNGGQDREDEERRRPA